MNGLKFIKSYIKLIDILNEKIGVITSWLTALLVLIVGYDVFVRYLIGESSVGLQEFEWHLFALIFLLAAAYTLKIDEHVRVDVFYVKLSLKKKAWINLLGALFFLIPFCLIVILSSQDFVEISIKVNETSPDAGGLPARYLLKAVIPFSFLLLLLQGIALVFKSFLEIKEN